MERGCQHPDSLTTARPFGDMANVSAPTVAAAVNKQPAGNRALLLHDVDQGIALEPADRVLLPPAAVAVGDTFILLTLSLHHHSAPFSTLHSSMSWRESVSRMEGVRWNERSRRRRRQQAKVEQIIAARGATVLAYSCIRDYPWGLQLY